MAETPEKLLGEVTNQLKEQGKTLGKIRANTALAADPKKDAGDKEREKESIREEEKKTDLLAQIETNTRGMGSGIAADKSSDTGGSGGLLKGGISGLLRRFLPKGAAALLGAGTIAKLGIGAIAVGGLVSALDAVSDGIKGYNWGKAAGKEPVAAALGHFLGGTTNKGKGGLKSAGVQGMKGAAIGATIGMIGGPVGMLIGGIAGAAIGGIAGYIGGKALTEFADKSINTFKRIFGFQVIVTPEEEAALKKKADVLKAEKDKAGEKLANLRKKYKQMTEAGATQEELDKIMVEIGTARKAYKKSLQESQKAINASIQAENDKAANVKNELDDKVKENKIMMNRLKLQKARTERYLKNSKGNAELEAKHRLDLAEIEADIRVQQAKSRTLATDLKTATEKLVAADEKAMAKAKKEGTIVPWSVQFRVWKRGFAKKIEENWESVKKWPGTVTKWASDTWTNSWTGVKDTYNKIKESAKKTWEDAKKSASTYYTNFKTNVTASYDAAKKNVKAAYDTMSTKLSEGYTALKGSLSSAWTSAKETWSDTKKTVDKWWTNVKTNTTKTFEETKKNLSNGYAIAKKKMGDAFTDFTSKFTMENLKNVGGKIKDWIITGAEKLWDKLPSFPTLESIKEMLPKWLTDPIGWFKSLWAGKSKKERDAERIKAKESVIEKQKASLGASGEEGEKQQKRKAAQEEKLKKLQLAAAKKQKKFNEQLSRIKDANTRKQLIKDADRQKYLSFAGDSMGGYRSGRAARRQETTDMLMWAKSQGIMGLSEDQIKFAWSNEKDKRAAEGFQRHGATRIKAPPGKQTGGSITPGVPFIAHEGELVVPSTSGLVLNQSVTQSILKAGIERYSNAGGGGGAGGNNIITVAPTNASNTSITNTSMVTRRALPFVAVS